MKLVLCHYVGCKELTTEYYCAKHKAIVQGRKPFEGARRVANYHCPEWQRLSRQVINEVKHCQLCGSADNLSVHHLVPVRECPERFLDRTNLVVLCRLCHQRVTAQEIRQRNR